MSRRLPGAFVAPMSHLDLTFMGTVEECLSRGAKVFGGALALLDSQPAFRFFLEYVLFLEAYRDARPAEAARLDAYVRQGRVELGAEWSGLFVAQEDEEDLVRNVLYAKRYARERYGLDLETLQLTDIPGVVPQLPQLCAGLGIRNLVLTRCAPPDTLFWYEAPDGARVLTWSADGYNEAARFGLHLGVEAMRERGLAERLRPAGAAPPVPPLLYYGSDLFLPPPRLAEAVAAWNAATTSSNGAADGAGGGSDVGHSQVQAAKAADGAADGAGDRLATVEIATPTAFFRAVREAGLAERAPVLRGELPSTWLYAEPDHAHVSRWDAPAARTLDAAERFSTLAWLWMGTPYPKAELAALWQAQLLARDHNYGGKGAGGGQPRKLAERRTVLHRSQALLSRALAAIAEHVEVPRESVPLVVFNPLNWDRADVVHAHVTFYPGVDPASRDLLPRDRALILRDPGGRAVPFQVTADRSETLGEMDLAFVAHDVPGLGYAAYTLEADAGPAQRPDEAAFSPVVTWRRWFAADPAECILDNGLVRLVVDTSTGEAALQARATGANREAVVTRLRLEGREELPEVRRTPPRALSFDDAACETAVAFIPADGQAVRVADEGPVLATVAVRGTALGQPAEVRYTLARELPYVEVEVRLDWDLRRFGRVEVAYEVPLPQALASYGLPFGAGRFGADALLPGSGPVRPDEAARDSWERTREITRWLDLANEQRGVAMATSHRWTRVDARPDAVGLAVRCCLVRGGRMRPAFPLEDGEDPRARLVYRFRFLPHAGSWQSARIPRAGWEAVQPLVSYTVNDTWSAKSLPRRQALAAVARLEPSPAAGDKPSGDGLLTCLKPAEAGHGVVARWYEATGHPCAMRVALPHQGALVDVPWQRTSLLEEPLATAAPGAASGGSVPAGPWEIVTVRTAARHTDA